MPFQTFQAFRSQLHNRDEHPWTAIATHDGFRFEQTHRDMGASVQIFTKPKTELRLITNSVGQHSFLLTLPNGKQVKGDTEMRLRGALMGY